MGRSHCNQEKDFVFTNSLLKSFLRLYQTFFEISGILEVNDGKMMVKESIYIKYRIYI